MRYAVTPILALALALGAPLSAGAQTAPGNDPHHPGNSAPPAAGATAPAQAPGAERMPQLGMMMGDMQQMMGMMGQMMGMMQMMAGGPGGGGRGMPSAGMPGVAMPGVGMPGGMAGTGPRDGGLPMGLMGREGAGRGFGMGGGSGPMAGRYTAGMTAFYKAELDITPAQEPQWSAFAVAMRDGMNAMREAAPQRMSAGQPQSAPERMDAHVARLSAALESAKAITTAGKALYAVLTPEQREIADQFMAARGRGMMP